MLAYAALLTLASLVAADFNLVATGGSLSYPVNVDGSKLVLNGGSSASFNLEEPAGYLSTSGGYATATPNEGVVLNDKGDASSNWGFVDGKLRLGAGATGGSTDFYACPSGDSYTIWTFSSDGCVLVSITQGDATAPASTSAAPETSTAAPETSTAAPETSSAAPETTSAAPETTSAAPETSSEAPTTLASSTVTSEVPSVTSSFVAGAGQAKIAAGAIAAVGAFLL